jgi:serine/threonine protein kinase/CheY-like chemotaxis protein/tetratricopeptide (TPR) repeat protein
MSDEGVSVPSGEVRRILLVDGDATSLDGLRRTLEGRGYRLSQAESGEEALDIARRVRPVLVLLDVLLPGIDGYETCRRLKADPQTRDAVVILLGSLREAKDQGQAQAAGAVDFITKPIQGADLIERVKTHVPRLAPPEPRPPQTTSGGTRVAVRDRDTPARLSAAPGAASLPELHEPLSFDAPPDPAAPVFHAGEVVSGRFRIVRFLAQGGMGELYEAEDLELRERVALKTILPLKARDERAVSMFKREVHLARQVTHPNVCRIYDVFRHHPPAAEGEQEPASEVVFLAMELLQGETLAARLERERRVSTADALPLVRQMAAALSAAHRAGVVHRDFKTLNVMLVKPVPPDEGPRVVVTDFGLARRSAHDAVGGLSVSLVDDMSGTPTYMAPEQVEGGPLTAAADLYALGVVMYEMVTGARPFVGDTPLQTAVKRLQAPAPTPRIHLPDIDARWEATILRCLARQPEDRFPNAEAVVAALEGKEALPKGAAPRRRRWTIAASLLGLSVMALAAGALLVRGRRPAPLSATDTVVLADFANSTGEPVFDDTLQQALATSLQQSPFFNLLPDRTVRDTLKLMGRSSGERVTGEVAQELCERTQSKAVIAGSIARLGSQYVVGLNALDCQTGASLARQQAPAARQEEVLEALDRAAKSLRGTVGESLGTIEAYATPIQQATTSSLEALKAYSLGLKTRNEKGDAAAIPFYQRAAALDPDFAMAYTALGNAYHGLRQHGLASENFHKAYALRERVSEREKFAITTSYYSRVTAEVEKANQTYELWAQSFPRDWVPPNNLGVNYASLGQYEKALAVTLESLRLNPDSAVTHTNLVANYCRLNRLGEAKAAGREALARKLDRPNMHSNLYGVAFLEGDEAEMQRRVAAASGKPGLEDILLTHQADTEAFSGRLGRARESSRRAVESAKRAGEPERAAQEQLNLALQEAEFGHAASARREAAAALALAPTLSVRVLAALALARSGDPDRAQAIADELYRQNPLNANINGYWLPTVRAAVALERGTPSKAVEILQAAVASELGVPDPQPGIGGMLYPAYLRGQAYLSLDQGTAAAAEFQKFLDHPGVVVNCPLGALARLGLARAHALQGDSGEARAAYDDFFRLWKDADPDIPILRRAKAEYSRTK